MNSSQSLNCNNSENQIPKGDDVAEEININLSNIYRETALAWRKSRIIQQSLQDKITPQKETKITSCPLPFSNKIVAHTIMRCQK